MQISPKTKFTLINTLFFGVIGSLLGGVIPAIGMLGGHDPMLEHTDRLFTEYVLGSLAIGIIPALIAGFLYSRFYRRELLRVGAVDFWKELKYGAVASFLAILGVCFVLFILFWIDEYSNGHLKIESLADVIWMFIASTFALGFLGVLSGMACSNLLREWNQNMASKLS